MKTANKTNRSIKLICRTVSGGLGIAITVGRKTDCYWAWEIPAYAGRAFRVEKENSQDVYNVLVENAQDGVCDCLGHEAHGHCKHVSGLRALLAAGKI